MTSVRVEQEEKIVRMGRITSPNTMVPYKNMVTGESLEKSREEEIVEGEDYLEGMQVEERKVWDYECPELILMEDDERRIVRPWKKGVIVKIMHKILGFKALKTRLNHFGQKEKP